MSMPIVLAYNSIAALLELCLSVTYFYIDGQMYEQREGVGMGSPMSAVVADLYMDHFKQLALESAPSRPRLWKRYVDDTCYIVRFEVVEEWTSCM